MNVWVFHYIKVHTTQTDHLQESFLQLFQSTKTAATTTTTFSLATIEWQNISASNNYNLKINKYFK